MNKLYGLLLIALLTACQHKDADPVQPTIALQGTWQQDSYANLHYDLSMKYLASTTHSTLGTTCVFSDSVLEASDAHTITPGHYPYRRDGDSLRIKLYPPLPDAFAIAELTAHKLTLRKRRSSLVPPVQLATGTAYYEIQEIYYTR